MKYKGYFVIVMIVLILSGCRTIDKVDEFLEEVISDKIINVK